MPIDQRQRLVYLAALSTLLLETLESTSDSMASDEFIVELRELSERAKAQLQALRQQ